MVVTAGCGDSATSPLSASPTFSLTGLITDSATGAAVPGALVSIADGLNAGRSVTTALSGSYSLPALRQSGFTVTVSAGNYSSAAKGVTLTSDQVLSFRLVRSDGIFEGRWVDNWLVQSCADSGSLNLAEFCASFNAGRMILILTQSGTAVQGTLDGLGSAPMNVAGQVSSSGFLTLSGQGTLGSSPLTLNDWQSKISGDTMTGSFTFTLLTGAGVPPGSATVTATFVQAPRVG
jgi:hypothetical protein